MAQNFWLAEGVSVGDGDEVADSIADRLIKVQGDSEVVDVHLHSNERWFGAAVAPNAEIHVADRIGTSVTAFQANAGNNTWGNWLQVLGSSDTPADAGKTWFDLHRLFIAAVQRSTFVHFIQVGYGASGAAALAAGTYTEFVYKPASATAEETPVTIQNKRHVDGTKAWVRVFVPTQNLGTVDFWIGLHEYED